MASNLWVRAAETLGPSAVILLYHRVSEKKPDAQLLCVSPQHFAEHMDVLGRQYRPTRLLNVGAGRWPKPGSVVVTFDDGYADNFDCARSILAEGDIPATVFVITGNMGAGREFWWDTLERVFLTALPLANELNLRINGRTRRWALEPAEQAQPDVGWNVLMDSQPTLRQTAYLELMDELRALNAQARESLLDELRGWAGVDSHATAAESRRLSRETLSALAKGGLIEVGAHTANHPVLAGLSPEAQRAEIAESKRTLEAILGRPVVSFAYPFGGRRDYDAQTVRIVCEQGFSCACANFPGRATALTHRYQLPRHVVRDWDGETFGRQLAGWFRA